jgi:hydroxysqualene dehydroxylase
LGLSVGSLSLDGNRVSTVDLADGSSIKADWVVSALPPSALLDVLPDRWREDPVFVPARTHTWSPIVNLHIWYDRPIGDFEFLAFVESPVQWVFNRSRIAQLSGPRQYITVSLSGAWEYWPLTKDELRNRFIPELARLFPSARSAKVERFIVVKEQHATFRSLPGVANNRLQLATPIDNLFIAGDWTDTGWPATMEGAVRSGEMAAKLLDESRRTLGGRSATESA